MHMTARNVPAAAVRRHARLPIPVPAAAAAGLVAPGVFFTVMLILGFARPGYSPVRTAGSNLSLGSTGPYMIANFVVYGLLELVFATALRRAYAATRAGRAGARAVALGGIAFLVAGVFVTDPAAGKVVTVHGALHVAAALVLFFAAWPAAIACFARYFRRERLFAGLSATAAAAIPVLFVATWTIPGVFGLLERIMLGVGFAWLTALAAHLYRDRNRLPEQTVES